jgi:glutamate-1-semialdehyde 2,1-aminomutase
VAYGGAQARYSVKPDITCLGKVIGGGLPAAAYGGRRDIMELIAPAGPVYQAGTLSGNPLAMVAGITTLRAISAPGVFERLSQVTAALSDGFTRAAHAADIPFQAGAAGSMWGFFFAAEPIHDYAAAKQHADTARFGRFFHAMLERGVYLAPSQFEAAFVSLAHDDALVAQTIGAAADAFAAIKIIS